MDSQKPTGMTSKGMAFGVMEVAIKGRLPSDPSHSWDALDPPPDLGLKAEQVFLHSFGRGGKARRENPHLISPRSLCPHLSSFHASSHTEERVQKRLLGELSSGV